MVGIWIFFPSYYLGYYFADGWSDLFQSNFHNLISFFKFLKCLDALTSGGKKKKRKPYDNVLLAQSSLCSLEVSCNEKGKGGRRETFYNRKKRRQFRKHIIYLFVFNVCLNYHSSVLSGTAGSYFCQGLMVMVAEEKWD